MTKGTTWGTAVALGATLGVLIEEDGGLRGVRSQNYLPADEMDTPCVLEGDLGVINPVDFSIKATMRYDPGQLGTALAGFFGTAGAPSLLDTTAYKHVFQWADEVYGNFITYAVERPGKILEVPSAKVIAVTFTIEEALLKVTFNLRGDTVIDDSSVNTATQMDAITYVDRSNRIKYPQISVKMNDESGGDVASESALDASALSITFNRPHDGEHGLGSSKIMQPVGNAKPSELGPRIHIDFPRDNAINAEFWTKFTGETEQKLLIKCTGALIESTYYYDLAFFFPRARVLGMPDPSDQVLKSAIDLVGEEAASAPTGMDYARWYIELVNLQSTDYLA
jgi:hypothetical protein